MFAIFVLTLAVIALVGNLLARRLPQAGPGLIPEIPPYALPRPGRVLANTWERTRDILTIVTPLLIGGSVVLALLAHVGADRAINTLLTPALGTTEIVPAMNAVQIATFLRRSPSAPPYGFRWSC